MKEKKLGKADLHIHSHYSDAEMSVKQILDYVQEKTDLDVIAICDHDTMKGAYEAVTLMENGFYRFELVLGEEITSQEGHIVGLFLQSEIPAGLSVKETLKRIRAQKGIAIAAHPFYHSKMKHSKYATMDGIGATTLLKNNKMIDGVEIVNATPTLSDENIGASILNKTILFNAEVGSSDAHIIEAIGMGYTLFEGKSAQDLRHSILEHQTRAMFKKWTYLGLVKYAYFYIPRGLRLLVHTIIHGRKHRKPDLLEEKILTNE